MTYETLEQNGLVVTAGDREIRIEVTDTDTVFFKTLLSHYDDPDEHGETHYIGIKQLWSILISQRVDITQPIIDNATLSEDLRQRSAGVVALKGRVSVLQNDVKRLKDDNANLLSTIKLVWESNNEQTGR